MVGAGDAQTCAPSPRRWRLVDRLGEQIIRDLWQTGGQGASKRMLADRYGISASGVKASAAAPPKLKVGSEHAEANRFQHPEPPCLKIVVVAAS